mmetsp:Transcript_22029/g.33173  ORF Transcript_22029/g.33173 Transcript_22029/m.33173 type:complete len:504 (+) Transcript_22029:128-1639(+)
MRDSLFLSAAFIIVEIGLIVATSIAAYELWIGDFIWANEEKQRPTIQSQRGGGISYEPLYNTTRREYYDRSLSATQKDNRSGSSRRTSSPDDGYDRTTNPGRGSTGDSTRRLFYKLILIALLCRLICFPIETFTVSTVIIAELTSTNKHEPAPPSWVLLRASQTLPDMAFASAFGLLIVFCAQVAYAALPLTSQSSDGSLGADDNAVGNGNTSPQPARDDDFNKQQSVTNIVQLQSLFDFCSGCARKTLASKITFFMWNTILLISFMAIFFAALATPAISLDEFEICLWLVLIGVYSLLSLVLIFTGVMLMKALRPGMLQRKGINSLALRLMGMCALLGCVFLDRLISFGIVAQRTRVSWNNEEEDGQSGQYVSLAAFRRNAINYAFFEVLPVLFILFIMHRKKKEPAANGQNDVLITNSIMSNIFGSSARPGNAQLDTTLIPPASSGINSKGGGLGSRRFQTYHGSTSRADSFPPKVKHGGNAAKINSQATLSKESSPLLSK